MKKILVVLTGGTIGSKVESVSKTIHTTPAFSYQLISMYHNQFSDDTDVDFDVIQPLNILSENMSPKYWGILCSALLQVNYKDYAGIIITHGSDTLSYTSALIGMLFSDIKIPVVLVASNLALGLPKSNGIANFRNAVCFIKEHLHTGVFTIFQNPAGENDVFLSTHLIESDSFRDAFRSFSGYPFGHMIDEHFEIHSYYNNSCYESLFYDNLKAALSSNRSFLDLCKLDFSFSNQVLLLRAYPGMNYSAIDLSTKPAAVVHYLYHSATACTDGDNSLIPFINRCKDAGVDFYCASFKSRDIALYETSRALLDAGAIPLYNISPEAAYTKLCILYNQTGAPVDELLYENLYFESLSREQ